MRYYVITLCVIALCTPVAVTHAVGLAVTPAELWLSGRAGEEARATLTVTNTTKGAALFEVYPDDPDAGVSVSPENFLLESGEEREVVISAMSREAGKVETVVSVVANPASAAGFRAGAGVKVPLHLTVADGTRNTGLASIGAFFKGYGAYLGIALAALFLFFRYFRIAPRKKIIS